MKEFAAVRNTCFAITSAIEDDFRSLILAVADATGNEIDVLPSDVREVALKRRSNDHRMDSIGSDVGNSDLLPYIDFADIAKIIESRLVPRLEGEREWLVATARALLSLTSARNRVCHTRPLEPEDLPKVLDFAQSLISLSSPFRFPAVAGALARLQAEPSFVFTLQIPQFWSEQNPKIHNNLPIPEFDETGFLGRSGDRMQVLKLLNSHYPVITIVGEGGIGKTALALRCLYDILDDQSSPYDAIVWVSMKTSALTQTGVQELNGAITSTLGLLSEIAANLGTPGAREFSSEADCIEEIAEYLTLYRIIVAIDNLETISTGSLRELLKRVPSQSKILLTSRIGVGEFEARYPLQGLDEKTSAILFRSYSRILGLAELSRLDEGNVKGYCRKLFHNPLLIKWFIASVARGADPVRTANSTAQNFSAALSFCFDNLFSRFGNPERVVIDTLASARKPLSSAEIHFLTPQLSSVDAEIALSALHNSSVVTRSKAGEDSFEYTLSESAISFISSKAPPSAAFFKQIQSRMRELRLVLTEASLRSARYEYDPFYVRSGDNRDEKISATYLRRALDTLKKSDFSGARMAVDEAKRLTPSNAEAWRIGGLVEQHANEFFRASENYEQAVGLNSRSKIARYCFGMFLMSDLEDFEGALAQFEVAIKLDSAAAPILTAKAMCLTRMGRPDEAAFIHEGLLVHIRDRERRWRLTGIDQAADCYKRWSFQDFEKKEFASSRQHALRGLQIIFDAAKVGDFDEKLLQRTARIVGESLSKKDLTNDLEFTEAAISLAECISLECGNKSIPINSEASRVLKNSDVTAQQRDRLLSLDRSTANREMVSENTSIYQVAHGDSTPVLHGHIHNLAEGPYGFIQDSDGKRWFFHSNFLKNSSDWALIAPGVAVSYSIGYNSKGECAVDISIRNSTR